MLDEQASMDLAIHTAMSLREARYFLLLLKDWQQKEHLSDELVAKIKQAAIDEAHVTGESPTTMLISMYGVLIMYRGE